MGCCKPGPASGHREVLRASGRPRLNTIPLAPSFWAHGVLAGSIRSNCFTKWKYLHKHQSLNNPVWNTLLSRWKLCYLVYSTHSHHLSMSSWSAKAVQLMTLSTTFPAIILDTVSVLSLALHKTRINNRIKCETEIRHGEASILLARKLLR